MLLAFDIGNTNTVIGIFDGNEMIANWRLSTDVKRTSDEYGAKIHSLFLFKQLEFQEIDDVIISCVVPDALQHILWFVDKYLYCEPMVVGSGLKTGINMKIDNPKSSGADLVVTAAGAYHKYHETLVIVDMGTATTVTAVSYTHLRAHETDSYLVCRLLLEKNFFNDTATTEIYTILFVGSVRCV